MKLADLNPQWEARESNPRAILIFDCPAQHQNHIDERCKIVIPIYPTPNGWTATLIEDFDLITVVPSIWHHCEKNPHFFIQRGEIVYA